MTTETGTGWTGLDGSDCFAPHARGMAPNEKTRPNLSNLSTTSISDHAVIRFLERHYGLWPFLAAVRAELAHAAKPAIDFGAPVVLAHGCRLVLREGIVVTVLPKADCARSRAQPYRRNQHEGE